MNPMPQPVYAIAMSVSPPILTLSFSADGAATSEPFWLPASRLTVSLPH